VSSGPTFHTLIAIERVVSRLTALDCGHASTWRLEILEEELENLQILPTSSVLGGWTGGMHDVARLDKCGFVLTAISTPSALSSQAS
jgi:hypothetical protein